MSLANWPNAVTPNPLMLAVEYSLDYAVMTGMGGRLHACMHACTTQSRVVHACVTCLCQVTLYGPNQPCCCLCVSVAICVFVCE